jgi:23S rRNA (adenine2030-N6)-methyltransferase
MLREIMPYLVKALGRDAGAGFVLETGTPSAVPGSARRARSERE